MVKPSSESSVDQVLMGPKWSLFDQKLRLLGIQQSSPQAAGRQGTGGIGRSFQAAKRRSFALEVVGLHIDYRL